MSAGEHYHTLVVGGGQAGLAAAYYLKKQGTEFVVLDAGTRPGDPWRNRWDSLRLFTPSKFDALPGESFPGDDFYFPTKDEVAAYLESYVQKHALPVRTQTAVDSITRTNGSFTITSGSRTFSADNVIVATGAYQHPFIPAIDRELDGSIVRKHSSAYRHPGQLPQGTILVVGAGNSGAEIAIELARAGRTVYLSGREVGQIPADKVGKLFGGRPYWLFLSKILSIYTPIGRNVRRKALHQGTPWIRLKPHDLIEADVIRCPRVVGVFDGMPKLEDGRVLDVDGIVWATGFKPNFKWIGLPVFDSMGYPVHYRGVVPGADGLYFVGLHFQTALSSALLGGVGSDARYVVGQIHARQPGRSTTVH